MDGTDKRADLGRRRLIALMDGGRGDLDGVTMARLQDALSTLLTERQRAVVVGFYELDGQPQRGFDALGAWLMVSRRTAMREHDAGMYRLMLHFDSRPPSDGTRIAEAGDTPAAATVRSIP